MLGEERDPFRIISSGSDEPYRRDPGVKEIQNGCPDVWVRWQGVDVKEVPSPSSGEPQGLPPSLRTGPV